jgi:hypothetical protein
MARTAMFAAGVLSLILGGTWGNAQANPDLTSAHNPALASADGKPGVIRLLGKTLCFPKAPLEVPCDWRMPALKADGPARTASAFTLFGQRYCIGETAEGHCDFQFPPPSSATEPKSKRFRLLGMDFCFGDVQPGPTCHVRLPLPTLAPADADRRASL